jgi:hypothetical protein
LAVPAAAATGMREKERDMHTEREREKEREREREIEKEREREGQRKKERERGREWERERNIGREKEIERRWMDGSRLVSRNLESSKGCLTHQGGYLNVRPEIQSLVKDTLSA